MTTEEQIRFVKELVGAELAAMLKTLGSGAVPEEWDGHELRRWIADRFELNVLTVGRPGPYGKPYRGRHRAYTNDVRVLGLL